MAVMVPSGRLRWAHQPARGPGAPERYVLQQQFICEPDSVEAHWSRGYEEWHDVPVWECLNEQLK
jgi:hypothetical protein